MAGVGPLATIYRDALELCDPAALVRRRLEVRSERDWLGHRPCIVLGKAGVRLAAGLRAAGWSGKGIAIVPSGYAEPGAFPPTMRVEFGSHPVPDRSSFEAGETLIRFASSLRESALVIVSGGASAAVEAPLAPHVSREQVAELHRLLLRSGLPIESMNLVRKHVSALKGGRLAGLLPPESRGWILSDVTPGREDLVGSGPLSSDASSNADAAEILDRIDAPLASHVAELLRSGEIPETPVAGGLALERLADNDDLVRAAAGSAAKRGHRARRVEGQLEGDVAEAASILIERSMELRSGEVLFAGGEPTVQVRGEGVGGRCSELAARLLLGAAERGSPPFDALIGSSDGRDGNSGAAGYELSWTGEVRWNRAEIELALARSDAHTVLARLGEPIMMESTGNNLRDIMMMARP